ncbi:antibiotic biosynthesis monooxygenase [Actinomadura sp. SCN-SB]|uniref:antibiotic biosynthesis monooxygenase n=1 Tax=Actinomadura sp. SCN-SB TaxID=3373092 RepID=UPI0037504DCD
MARWKCRMGRDPEALRLWEERVLDVWRAQPGLLHVHLLARDGSDERMTLSVWESEAACAAFVQSAALHEIASAYEQVYTADGRPMSSGWTVLTDDWPVTAPVR